jgi:thymidylate synthase (FAD)
MTKQINVLDKGYVRLVNHMGSDLTVVNAARVSFDKESHELSQRDERLINFLAKHDHTSPFRHATLQFEVYAPLMVARQWWKYVVGSDHVMDGWNESSRRYVTEEPTFYVPKEDEWRSAPENSKQGSGEPVDAFYIGEHFTRDLIDCIERGIALYESALEHGICAEQARLFLPAYGMYVRWRWTASLQSVCHLIQQRVSHDAQKEFQEYAKAVLQLTRELFPVSVSALIGDIK